MSEKQKIKVLFKPPSNPKLLPNISDPKTGLNVTQWSLFSAESAKLWFNYLEKPGIITYLPKEETRVKVFGKVYDTPRQVTSYGDPGIKYKFSGSVIKAIPWTPELLILKSLVEDICKCNFNYVLINRYKDGQDTIGYHQDDEGDLVNDAPIASLSFGATRDFILKHAHAKKKSGEFSTLDNVVIPLTSGSLLIMNHPTNKNWYHSIPKRTGVKQPRINLTFRCMK